MHTDRTDTIDRPGCAAAAAGVYCSPRCFHSRGRDCENPLLPTTTYSYSCDGCGRTFAQPPQMWKDRCGWCQWGTPDGLPPVCRHCGLATGTTDPCCSASLGLSDDTEAAEPDYWQSLAADLRRSADRVASLAGTPAPEVSASLYLHVGLYVEEGHEERRPVVETVAAAFDAPPALRAEVAALRAQLASEVVMSEVPK